MATPPCQGMSIAGKMDENDPRNSLIINTIEFIKKTLPSNIIIENVPQILKFSIKINGKQIKILDYKLVETISKFRLTSILFAYFIQINHKKYLF
jgi:DNA (cytosine-5)-methyltransferase 1